MANNTNTSISSIRFTFKKNEYDRSIKARREVDHECIPADFIGLADAIIASANDKARLAKDAECFRGAYAYDCYYYKATALYDAECAYYKALQAAASAQASVTSAQNAAAQATEAADKTRAAADKAAAEADKAAQARDKAAEALKAATDKANGLQFAAEVATAKAEAEKAASERDKAAQDARNATEAAAQARARVDICRKATEADKAKSPAVLDADKAAFDASVKANKAALKDAVKAANDADKAAQDAEKAATDARNKAEAAREKAEKLVKENKAAQDAAAEARKAYKAASEKAENKAAEAKALYNKAAEIVITTARALDSVDASGKAFLDTNATDAEARALINAAKAADIVNAREALKAAEKAAAEADKAVWNALKEWAALAGFRVNDAFFKLVFADARKTFRDKFDAEAGHKTRDAAKVAGGFLKQLETTFALAARGGIIISRAEWAAAKAAEKAAEKAARDALKAAQTKTGIEVA